jgi:hypothetical protein
LERMTLRNYEEWHESINLYLAESWKNEVKSVFYIFILYSQ